MPITENSDTVETLLEPGTTVETEEGRGVIKSIALNAAEYNDEWQLEPPSIEVELENGEIIYTCICELVIPSDDEATELLHSEYDRLWPPMTDEVPEDAEMLIPEGKEEEMGKRTATIGGILAPDDIVWLVIVPKPGSLLWETAQEGDYDEARLELISEGPFRTTWDFFRGTLPRDMKNEEYYFASTEDEAMDILLDKFPHLIGE